MSSWREQVPVCRLVEVKPTGLRLWWGRQVYGALGIHHRDFSEY